MRQKTTTIAAALFLLILSATAYAASVSITANTRNDGALEITANGTNYASCDGNPNGGIAELYIEDTLYCAQYADGNSSCTTVFSNGTLSGTTTFTATATDCQGTATTTYTIALDDTPTARPTTPDAGEQTVSVSISVDVRSDGGVAVTSTGSGYASCNGNPNGGVARLYIGPTLYCAQYAEGTSSCTTVFDRATLNGSHTFTATATDCQGYETTTYTLVLDNTPSITPTGPTSPVSGLFNFTADVVFQPTLNSTKGTIYLYVDGGHVGGVDKACTTVNCTYDYQSIAGHLYELPHGGFMTTIIKEIIVTLLIGLTFSDVIFAKENCLVQETIVQHPVIEQKKKIESKYTKEECGDIKAAKEVIKNYWRFSYEDIYRLLSNNFKERLRQTQNITNATEYKISMSGTERVWLKQEYQKAEFKNNSLQITVLATWEEEGYEGVATFIFNIVKENSVWKIENIMF